MNRVRWINGLVVSLLAMAAVVFPTRASSQSVYQAIDHALSACASMVVSGGTRDALLDELRAARYVIAGGEFRLRADWGFLKITSLNTSLCFVDLPEMDPEQALGLTKIFVAGLGAGWQAGVADDPQEAAGATYRVSEWHGPTARISFIRDPDGRTHVTFNRAADPPGS